VYLTNNIITDFFNNRNDEDESICKKKEIKDFLNQQICGANSQTALLNDGAKQNTGVRHSTHGAVA
jgi:hypothetical protein